MSKMQTVIVSYYCEFEIIIYNNHKNKRNLDTPMSTYLIRSSIDIFAIVGTLPDDRGFSIRVLSGDSTTDRCHCFLISKRLHSANL